MTRRLPFEGTPPPSTSERPRCIGCDRTLRPTVWSVWNSDNPGNPTGSRWTGEFDGYPPFCTLRCALSYARWMFEKHGTRLTATGKRETMKTIKARYESSCAGCGGTMRKGDTITGTSGDWYHGSGAGQGCAPSGNARADAVYMQGAREANRYLDDRKMFGEELADQWELERDLADPEGW